MMLMDVLRITQYITGTRLAGSARQPVRDVSKIQVRFAVVNYTYFTPQTRTRQDLSVSAV